MNNLNNRISSVAKVAAFLAISASGLLAQQRKPFLPPPPPVVSTVPSNGDVNPYGVAFIPAGFASGVLKAGDILVSNFNNSQNLQGTGTTITRIDETGKTSTFFQGSPGLGLTAALGVIRAGYVFVGNVPTKDGTSATVSAGSLLVLDSKGNLLATLTDPNLLDGPWGMAVNDLGETAQIFVSNVLNGSITRLDLAVTATGLAVRDSLQIGSGFAHRTDPAALVLGPSGLAYDAASDMLYIANSADNTIYSLSYAGTSNANQFAPTMVYTDATHLHGPLDLVMAPNGDLLVANSDGSNADPNQPSEIVEFTTTGTFVAQFSVDPANGGAFGIGRGQLGAAAVRFAAVDDNANTLSVFTVPVK